MERSLYKDWLVAFEQIGYPAIGRDTAARVLAVTYAHGNNEALTHNSKYLADIAHIQKMYGVNGGEVPDGDLIVLIQRYVKELEDYYEEHRNDKTDGEAVFHNKAPQWARDLFMNRYNIKLIN